MLLNQGDCCGLVYLPWLILYKYGNCFCISLYGTFCNVFINSKHNILCIAEFFTKTKNYLEIKLRVASNT